MSVPDAANSRASSGTGTEAVPQEVFVGMYGTTDTTGEALSRVIEDVLLRLNLPLSALRGQTYDGASSMAGQYSDCQAFIRQKNPLALYVHCGAHCVNLVMEAVAVCSPHLNGYMSLAPCQCSLVSSRPCLQVTLQTHTTRIAVSAPPSVSDQMDSAGRQHSSSHFSVRICPRHTQ